MNKQDTLFHYSAQLDLMLRAHAAGLRDAIGVLQAQERQIQDLGWLHENEHFHAALPGIAFAIGCIEARLEELNTDHKPEWTDDGGCAHCGRRVYAQGGTLHHQS